MTSTRRTVIVMLLAAAAALGQDKPKRAPKPKPDTPEQAAKKVLAAIEAKDATALAALAKKDDPDPWLVADLLCAKGRHDAAEAFAKAAPRKDVEKLPAYVASRRGVQNKAKARESLEAANRALAAGEPAQALAWEEGARAAASGVVAVRLLYVRGIALRGLRRLDESAKAFAGSAKHARRIGWLQRASRSSRAQGISAYFHGDWRGATAAFEQQLAIEESRGSRRGVARGLTDLAGVLLLQGAHARALNCQSRALAICEELNDPAGVARAVAGMGSTHYKMGSYASAMKLQERSLRLHEELGDRGAVAIDLGNLGNTKQSIGALAEARVCHERALRINEQRRSREGIAVNLGNLGVVCLSQGALAEALEYQERAIKLSRELHDRAGVARALGNLGLTHYYLGAHHKALDYHMTALKLKLEVGDRPGAAQTAGHIGNLYWSIGDSTKALAYQERAFKLSDDIGDELGKARALGNIGNIYYERGEYADALRYQEKSLVLARKLGDLVGIADTLINRGNAHHSLGALRKAREDREEALAIAVESGSLRTEVFCHWSLAITYLASEDPLQAARSARLGVEKLPGLVGRLADEQSALARDHWAGLLEYGVRAGVQLADPVETAFFMESGRAGALLESLGHRDALADVTVSSALRKDELAARAAVIEAQSRYTNARRTGHVATIRTARVGLKQARRAVLEVVARIQRSAKATADVVYPKAASLKDIRGSLRPHEGLVLYALLPDDAVALVVTSDDARIVKLGKTEVIERAMRSFDPTNVGAQPVDAAKRLRALVVDPLALPAATTRVLVSPHGPLSYVAFSLLLGDREVAYVPSGTTYRVLQDEYSLRGEGVLALGKRKYRATSRKSPLLAMRGAFADLPGAESEARSVGDVELLGPDANEARLRVALATRERWRAVHFACHAVLNAERPALSALVVTPVKGEDGFLMPLEVFRMKIPADLVVLSACETGKGKVYKAEGIVGFTRAFMFAGAPRVIVSLWKVDDDATRALMVKFYELWKTQPTATALKKAQEFVAAHNKWKHPFYWAAWQLWGLPD